MKKLLPFLIVLLFACAGQDLELGYPKFDPTICSEYPVEKSLIKKVSLENGLTLEKIYYPLIDATAIAMLTDALDRENVRDFLMDIKLFILSKSTLSYTYLIVYMTDPGEWGDNWPLIESILSRNINIFRSSLIISAHDRCLILHGIEGAERDLGL